MDFILAQLELPFFESPRWGVNGRDPIIVLICWGGQAIRPRVVIGIWFGNTLITQDMDSHLLFQKQPTPVTTMTTTEDLLANPFAVRNPNPLSLVPYAFLTGDYSAEGREAYITFAGISPSSHVPGIPSPYSNEQLEQRALYIVGIPAEWQTPAFRRIFQIYGTVEKCPVIIDLTSKCTFRFVIMSTTEECLKAKNSVHGFVLEGNTIYTTEALPSSSLLPLRRLDLPASQSQVEDEGEVGDDDEDDFTVADLKIRGNNNNVALNAPYVFGSGTLNKTPTTHGHPSLPSIRLPLVKVQEAESESEAEAQVATRKHRPAPLNLTGANDNTSRRVSLLLPAQSPFPTQVQFDPITEAEETASQFGSPTPTQPVFQTQASTWAAIVSSASPNHRNVDLHPETPRSGRRLNSIGRIPSVPAIKAVLQEPLAQQARVVLILNIPNTMTISDISNAVREGPVVCIRFGVDADTGKRFSGIVFQHAKDAQVFYDVLRQERADNMPNRFRFIADCVRGDPFPINDDILAMGAPTYASRRLTIVKKAFFFAFTGRNLQTLCEKVVSKENVQLVFIYNGGNATVVFAEVSAAIKMKARLDQLRDGAGNGTSSIYDGLQVTFSKDPCELEGGLNLQAADGYHA